MVHNTLPYRQSRQYIPAGSARKSFPRASDHQENDVHNVVQRPAWCHIVRTLPSPELQRRNSTRYNHDYPDYRAFYDFDIRWIDDAAAEVP